MADAICTRVTMSLEWNCAGWAIDPTRRVLALSDFAGEMAEWLKAHAWKACLGETLTWVRIPLSPPYFYPHKHWWLPKIARNCANFALPCVQDVRGTHEKPNRNRGPSDQHRGARSGPNRRGLSQDR